MTFLKKIILSLFFIFLVGFAQAQEYQHKHPQVLPTDKETWDSCCHDQDCMEAKHIEVQYLDDTWAIVQIDNFPTFKTERRKIKDSQNGKPYFCRFNVRTSPNDGNIICIFIVHNMI